MTKLPERTFINKKSKQSASENPGNPGSNPDANTKLRAKYPKKKK